MKLIVTLRHSEELCDEESHAEEILRFAQNDRKTSFRKNFSFLFFILCCYSCQSLFPQHKVCFQNQCVRVELAQKPEELARGLQFRKNLARDAGMLFIFPRSGIYSFWMKDTKIPLDMIWLDQAQRVVYIKRNAPPCVQESCVIEPGRVPEMEPCPAYQPDQEAMYVLEVNSGAAEAFNIQLGDTATFHLAQEK